MKGADSVELKLTVPDSDQRSAIEALGMDVLGAQARLVSFFDTPDPAFQSLPCRMGLPQFTDEDRIVVSEPLGDLPRAWREIPEPGAVIIQRGPDAQRVFEPRGR